MQLWRRRGADVTNISPPLCKQEAVRCRLRHWYSQKLGELEMPERIADIGYI